jgi:hypothetical protein
MSGFPIAAFSLILALSQAVSAQQTYHILPNGHSHNDYTRGRPLYDALSYGYASIEVDVYWNGKRMIVTHDDKGLLQKPDLQALYLDPLLKIINENDGRVFPHGDIQLVLMIDLKSDKVSTYRALVEIFSNYKGMIEWYRGDSVVSGPVRVVLSGNPPIELMQSESERYFSVDGRFELWHEDYTSELMPRASASYWQFFQWNGDGSMPEDELEKLRSLVNLAHVNGRKVRFWATPDRVEIWRLLMDEGVDWVNVDDLKGFYEFYQDYCR